MKTEKLEKKIANYTFLHMNSFKINTKKNNPFFNFFINSLCKFPIGLSIIITTFRNINKNRFI